MLMMSQLTWEKKGKEAIQRLFSMAKEKGLVPNFELKLA